MWKWSTESDWRTPEIYTVCQGFVPTSDGAYISEPVAVAPNSAYTLYPYSALGEDLSGVVRLYHGSSTKLYQGSTDVTRSSGGDYSREAWRFGFFGNIVIAVNGANGDVPQAMTMGGANFAALAGSPPKAAFIAVQTNAVLLFKYNDGSDYPDGWWASDIGDHTTWTPASSNEAANGRLISTPGAITGAVAFGNYVLAFKRSSVYRLSYVGGEVKWLVELLRGDIGAGRQDWIINTGDAVYFLGENGAWVFDGASFTRIDGGVWGGAGIGRQLNYRLATTTYSWSHHLPNFGVVEFGGYDGVGGSVYGFRYNYKSGLWSQIAQTMGIATYSQRGAPYGCTNRLWYYLAGSLYTVGSVSAASQDAWIVCGSDNKLYWRTGRPSTAASAIAQTLTTGFIGDHKINTEIRRVWPILGYDPIYHGADSASATFTLTPYSGSSPIGSFTAGSAVSSSGNVPRFDLLKTARFHYFTVANTATGWKIHGLEIDSRKAGSE